MATILGANTLSSGFNVANSVRFNDNDSPSMYKTPGSGGDQRTWTFSTWFKRGNLGSSQWILDAYDGSNDEFHIYVSSGNAIGIYTTGGGFGNNLSISTNNLVRDVSAWYHLVVRCDTTQGTASNRLRIYLNGVEATYGTYNNFTENGQGQVSESGTKHWIGRRNAGDYFDGYFAEMVLVDGSSLAPTSFGEFDSDSPKIWKPIDVSGLTFGTNGFYLDFEDSSNLGNDANGGTDWTEVNLAATDQSTDTCTNNFAVCNSTDSFSTGGTFSDGSLTTQSTTSNRGIFTATMGVSTGKWYWEIKTSASGGTHASDEWNYIGIANQIGASNTDNILATSGTDSNKVYEYAIHGHDGDFYNNGDQGTYAASFTTGDILGIFLDLDNNRIYWSKNGQWADGSGNSDEADPNGYKSVTDPASTPGGFYFPAWGDGGSNMNKTWQLNFGATPGFSVSSGNADPNGYGNFEYPTEGGYALCTKNLAEFG